MPLAETTLEKEAALLKGRTELCLEIFRGIVSGAREAHGGGIVHRDLKPSNVLFMDRSLRNPLIADFGICFVKGTSDEERLTNADETVGAKFFMAPEQERGRVTEVHETADIYALGKLLHFMLSQRYLFRESLSEAFEEVETNADPKLVIVRDEILARTIVLDPSQRLQTTDQLLKVIDRIQQNVGETRGVARGSSGLTNSPLFPTEEVPEKVRGAYYRAVTALDQDRLVGIKTYFDHCRGEFTGTWSRLREAIERQPGQAPDTSRELIRAQTNATGLTLAMARADAWKLFHDFKGLLEFIMRSSEGQSGYVAVHAVPHVLAGFLYMAAAVAALRFQSWEILARLLRSKFEWYYQSGRPIYDFGFELSYFFHSEALQRKANVSHDLFREEMLQAEILDLLWLSAEELLDTYLQTHLLMCLRGAQQVQLGEDAHMFADFGRFYEYRVIPLLDRMHNNREFALGVCKAFDESPDDWFARLNDRLKIVKSNFWSPGPFLWESLSSYEPR